MTTRAIRTWLYQLSSGANPTIDAVERAAAETINNLQPGILPSHPDLWNYEKILADPASSTALANLSVPFLGSRVDSPLEAAIKKNSDAHSAALRATGLSVPQLDLLRSWMEMLVE